MKISRVMIVLFALIVAGHTQGSPDYYVVSLHMPCYPPLTRQARIEGETKVRIEVGNDGAVTLAEALEGNPILKAASLANARTWMFRSGQGTDLTKLKTTIVFEYKLVGDQGWDRCATRVAFDSFNKVEVTGRPPVPVENDSPGQFPMKK